MKHAFQLASLSVAALFAASAQAGKVTTFNIDFEDGTVGSAPTAAESVGTWILGSGESAIAIADGNKYLELDTPTNSAVQFEPAKVGTSKIEMDVQFVGTSEEPLASRTGTQAALFLKRNGATTNLYLSVNGGAFANTLISVDEGEWYKVQLVFDYTSSQKSVALSVFTSGGSQVGSTYSANSGTTATGIVGVDFYGSGKVDNFIGQYAEYSGEIPMSSSTSSSSDGATTNTTATISNGVLSPNFAATYNGDNIKFIKVSGTIGGEEVTRTLRVVNGNQAIAISAAGFTAVSKVVAYYGDDVTATTGYTPATTTPTMDTNTESPTYGSVTGSVTVKSGLYYSIETNGTKTLLRNTPIAPEEEGTTLNYTVTPSKTGYDVVKFKIVASDDPVSAQ